LADEQGLKLALGRAAAVAKTTEGSHSEHVARFGGRVAYETDALVEVTIAPGRGTSVGCRTWRARSTIPD